MVDVSNTVQKLDIMAKNASIILYLPNLVAVIASSNVAGSYSDTVLYLSLISCLCNQLGKVRFMQRTNICKISVARCLRRCGTLNFDLTQF